MVRETKDFVMIDLTGIVKSLIKRFWIVVLCMAIGAGAAGWYSTTITVTPMYKATAKLYVTGAYAASVTSSTIAAGQAILASYYSILESRPVIEAVINKCGLNISVSKLKSCISQSSITGTSMINLSVSFVDPEWAKILVDALITESANQAYDIMGMTPPVIYEEAIVPTEPYNMSSNLKKYVLIGAGAGAAASILALIIWFLADNRLHTPQQLTWRTGLATFGIIPRRKGQKYGPYSRKALRHLYAEICAREKEVKTIAVAARKQEKSDVIDALKDFLIAIDKKVVVVNTDMLVAHGPAVSAAGASSSTEESKDAKESKATEESKDAKESKATDESKETYAAENPSGQVKDSAAESPEDRKSFEDYLMDKTDSIDEIVETVNGFDKIEARREVLNSYELLKGSRFSKLMEELKGRYDFVLIDTAPVDSATDAQAVFKSVDLKLLAIGCGKTSIGKAESAIKLLGGVDAIDGAVFTNVKVKPLNRDFRENFGAYYNVKSRERS